jgi:hypothetical protein
MDEGDRLFFCVCVQLKGEAIYSLLKEKKRSTRACSLN